MIGAVGGAWAGSGKAPPWLPPFPSDRLDPLALDLDGDGKVSTLHLTKGVHFDLDNSGFAEKTAWVSGNDALIARDINGNGVIDGGFELFGDGTRLKNGSNAAHGFAALADLDGNNDGRVDAQDADWQHLLLWQDKNQDGISQKEELTPFTDAHIAALLTAFSQGAQWDSSNINHNERGYFIREDGSQGALHSLWFATNKADSVAVDILYGRMENLPDALIQMPGARGYGNTHMLHDAMRGDDTLQSLVQAFLAESNPQKRHALSVDILTRWAKADHLQGMKGQLEAKQLATLEAFWGQKALAENPAGVYAQRLKDAYQDLHDILHAQLSLQTHYRGLYTQTDFRDAGNGRWSADYGKIAPQIADAFAKGQFSAAQLGDFFHNMDKIIPSDRTLGNELKKALQKSASELPFAAREAFFAAFLHGNDQIMLTNGETYFDAGTGNDNLHGNDHDNILLGGAGNDHIIGGKGDDVLSGDAGVDSLNSGMGNDTLIGGEGDDTLNGGLDNDTYRFSGNFGRDLVINIDSGKERHDVIRFDDLNQADLHIRRQWADLILENADGSKRVTVQRHFENHGDNVFRINEIRFADEAVLDIEPLKARVKQGTERNDYLYADNAGGTLDGGMGNDHLYGEKGDDALKGGDGSDQLYGNDGNDLLQGGAGNDHLGGDNGNDILDGGDGTDMLNGSSGDDHIDGGAGNDRLNGGTGSDTYRFSGNFGQDSIHNADNSANRHDVVRFTDLNKANLRIHRIGENLIFADTAGNRVTVENHFRDGSTGSNHIDEVRFADNTVLGIEELKTLVQQGSDGHDHLYADKDGSTLHGGKGNDRLHGAAGDDNLSGGEGDDHLQGVHGDDLLHGGAGRDNLTGGAGNDTMNGGTDNDWLYGEDGNDTLEGGEGADVFYGGRGADTFILHAHSAEKAVDTLGDFNRAEGDKIALADLLPDTLPGHWFAAQGDMHGASTRVYQQGGMLYYDPDGTGSGAPRAFAAFSRPVALKSEDFIAAVV